MRRPIVVFLVAVALLAGAAATLGAPATAAPGVAAPAAADVAAPASAAATQVERHSPAEGYPSLGPLDAKNTLVFFTDYQCPVCRRAAPEMDRLVADLAGQVRAEVRHNPLAMHRDAFDAAAAAKAAQRQGRFWEYHEALQRATSVNRAALLKLAGSLGLNPQKFAHDIEDPALRAEVTAESKQALDANALGTPGFLINGHVEVGWASLPWLEQIVRAHMK